MSKKAQELAEKHLATLKVPPQLQQATKELVTKMIDHPGFNNPDYDWSLDDFELGSRLGRGKFGRVYLAREKRTGMLVAVKTLMKREIVEGHVEKQVMREIEILSHLKHPNILQLLTWFHDSHRIYLVVDFAGKGELYRHLKNSPNSRFDEPTSAKYIYQVADALHYCHKNNVIHRDIKPENLLLTITGDVKLADFGWSVHTPSNKRKTMCGTLDYLPPEMIDGIDYRHFVDIWCLGVLCYEFLHGFPPFESDNKEGTYRRIKCLDMRFGSFVSEGAKDLISNTVVLNAERRLTLPQVMDHPWILSNKYW